MITQAHPCSARVLAMFVGFVVLWLILDKSAAGLGSMRGEAGFVVFDLVLAAALGVEWIVFRTKPLQAIVALGLRAPTRASLLWALAVGGGLLSFYPIYSIATGVSFSLLPHWPVLALGMFAQGGLAEEAVFRGYLFRHMREGRSFWRAAILAAIPFVAVHLFLFLTLDFALALASILVSLSISFPLAHLFDRSGGSIWPPAIIHAVVQSSIKVVEVAEGEFLPLAIWWMALSVVAPWILLAMESSCAAARGREGAHDVQAHG